MRQFAFAIALVLLAATSLSGASRAAPGDPVEPLDKRSGFYEFATFSESLSSGTSGPGLGTIAGTPCTVSSGTQDPVFAGNSLLNCDSIGPHNETTIAVNPTDPNNAIGGSHSFLLEQVGATINAHVISAAYVTKDGGQSWTNVHPPLGSCQFVGDPVLTFDALGRAYYVNLCDHEGQAGAFTNVSVIAQRSDDGGLTWTKPVTVAQGSGAVSPGGLGVVVFNDKPWAVTDTSPASPFRNNAYVTWTRFLFEQNRYIESPIFFSRSPDGGVTWTPGKEISGASATLCSAQLDTRGGASRCDEDQLSQPVVAPDGTIFVVFINEQNAANLQTSPRDFRDQFLVVRSTDGGETFTGPFAATGVIHDGVNDYPINVDGRQTLAGCQFRVHAAGALAVSSTGRLFYAFTENKTPGTSTQTDVMAVTSTDGGVTWSSPVTVNASKKDQVYPWAAVGTDGKLRVGYVDRDRRGPAGQSCVYGYSLSTALNDAATRFSSPVALETALSIASDSRFFRASGTNQTRFIGDYTNVAASPDGSVWSTWTDMRQTITLFGRTGKDQDAVAEKR